MKSISYFVLAALQFVTMAHASEEEFLRWRTVQIECFETPQTGRVTLKAEVGEKGIKSFAARAFGQSYILSSVDVAKISPFPLDGLKVTHAAAMRSGVGHSVTFRFVRLYYDKAQKLHREEAVVTVINGAGAVVSLRTLDGGS